MRVQLTGLLVFLSIYSSAQVFKNVQIPSRPFQAYHAAQCEPSIAINPNNTNEIVAGSVLDDYYYSLDGGKTWTSQQLKSRNGVYGDPVLAYDYKGRIYYFHLSNPLNGNYLDRITCQTAKKPWKKFTQGSSPAPNGTKVQDKHWVVVNPKNNHIYMTWTQFDKYDSKNPKDSSIILFSKSTNRGKSWSTPQRISKFGGDCVDSDNTVEGAVPALGKNGEIVVVWTGPRGLVMQRSADEGKTWLAEEVQIEEQVMGWDLDIPGVMRCNGLPVLMSDCSGKTNDGTLYLNWTDQRNGEHNTDVFIKKSTDNGTTWSEPIRVNQDATQTHQYLSWLTIDQSTGYLYVVYYDRRNYTDNQTDVYLSVSRDGGNTFVDHKISESPFTPNPQVFFGDYLNISAVNGVIRPIWPRMDKTTISLWIALIEDNELNK